MPILLGKLKDTFHVLEGVVRRLYIVNMIFLLCLSTAWWAGGAPLLFKTWNPNSSGKGTWFETMKPYCNPVEIGMVIKRIPPPPDETSQAYAAACYALAGKISKARATLDRFPSHQQEWAANIVFNVAHPIADAGDDESAGPIMQMVVGYSPNHYMARYHAGISLYATGHFTDAQQHLTRFLAIYHENNYWTQNAKMTLQKIQGAS